MRLPMVSRHEIEHPFCTERRVERSAQRGEGFIRDGRGNPVSAQLLQQGLQKLRGEFRMCLDREGPVAVGEGGIGAEFRAGQHFRSRREIDNLILVDGLQADPPGRARHPGRSGEDIVIVHADAPTPVRFDHPPAKRPGKKLVAEADSDGWHICVMGGAQELAGWFDPGQIVIDTMPGAAHHPGIAEIRGIRNFAFDGEPALEGERAAHGPQHLLEHVRVFAETRRDSVIDLAGQKDSDLHCFLSSGAATDWPAGSARMSHSGAPCYRWRRTLRGTTGEVKQERAVSATEGGRRPEIDPASRGNGWGRVPAASV